MNQGQKKYAISRLEQIAKSKLNENHAKHFRNMKKLSVEVILRMFNEGEIKMKKLPIPTPTYCYSIRDFFDLSEHEWEGGLSEEGKSRRNLIETKLTEAKDELMLGDADKAMELIKAFKEI